MPDGHHFHFWCRHRCDVLLTFVLNPVSSEFPHLWHNKQNNIKQPLGSTVRTSSSGIRTVVGSIGAVGSSRTSESCSSASASSRHHIPSSLSTGRILSSDNSQKILPKRSGVTSTLPRVRFTDQDMSNSTENKYGSVNNKTLSFRPSMNFAVCTSNAVTPSTTTSPSKCRHQNSNMSIDPLNPERSSMFESYNDNDNPLLVDQRRLLQRHVQHVVQSSHHNSNFVPSGDSGSTQNVTTPSMDPSSLWSGNPSSSEVMTGKSSCSSSLGSSGIPFALSSAATSSSMNVAGTKSVVVTSQAGVGVDLIPLQMMSSSTTVSSSMPSTTSSCKTSSNNLKMSHAILGSSVSSSCPSSCSDSSSIKGTSPLHQHSHQEHHHASHQSSSHSNAHHVPLSTSGCLRRNQPHNHQLHSWCPRSRLRDHDTIVCILSRASCSVQISQNHCPSFLSCLLWFDCEGQIMTMMKMKDLSCLVNKSVVVVRGCAICSGMSSSKTSSFPGMWCNHQALTTCSSLPKSDANLMLKLKKIHEMLCRLQNFDEDEKRDCKMRDVMFSLNYSVMFSQMKSRIYVWGCCWLDKETRKSNYYLYTCLDVEFSTCVHVEEYSSCLQNKEINVTKNGLRWCLCWSLSSQFVIRDDLVVSSLPSQGRESGFFGLSKDLLQSKASLIASRVVDPKTWSQSKWKALDEEKKEG